MEQKAKQLAEEQTRKLIEAEEADNTKNQTLAHKETSTKKKDTPKPEGKKSIKHQPKPSEKQTKVKSKEIKAPAVQKKAQQTVKPQEKHLEAVAADEKDPIVAEAEAEAIDP